MNVIERAMDVEKLQQYLLELTQRAGNLSKKYFRRKTLKKTLKGYGDFATEADYALDSFISENLKKEFPLVSILTEETAKDDLSIYKKEKMLFIVDPIDGTWNFARGDTSFAVSIGFAIDGLPLVGVLYMPFLDKMYTSRADTHKAQLNTSNIHVSSIDNFQEAELCGGWHDPVSIHGKPTHLFPLLNEKLHQVKMLGSACLEIAYVAEGIADASLHTRVKPWDVASAGLLAKEAGACLTTVDGLPWDIFSSSLLVANSKLHGKILSLYSDY